MTIYCFTRESLEILKEGGIGLARLQSIQEDPWATPDIALVRQGDVLFVVDPEADQFSKKIVITGRADGSLFGQSLKFATKQIASRLLSLLDRAESPSVNLPPVWAHYKDGTLLSFLAAHPDVNPEYLRWVAEVRCGLLGQDTYLWVLDTAANTKPLSDVKKHDGLVETVESEWSSALQAAKACLAQARVQEIPAGPTIQVEQGRGWGSAPEQITYEIWLDRLTPQQRAFVTRDLDHSVQVRGSAGTGKTLALEMRAVRRAREIQETGNEARLLFVTHSWAHAERVDSDIRTLSGGGCSATDLGIEVLPLVSIVQMIPPAEDSSSELHLLGEDSISGKSLQIERIVGALRAVRSGDWLTLREKASSGFRTRFESLDEDEEQSLTWDLLMEFSCVLGAEGIFPGYGAEDRYFRIARAPWMMSLETAADKRAVLSVYERYMDHLLDDRYFTTDQAVNYFLNYVMSAMWRVRRRLEGYDEIYVDELHLFDAQERLALRFLTRDTKSRPRIFMALDPRQSPWEVYTSLGRYSSSIESSVKHDESLDSADPYDLKTVHRFTPQTLDLIKFLHHQYPTLNLGESWECDFAGVSSSLGDGPKPDLIRTGSSEAEMLEVYVRLQNFAVDRKNNSGQSLAVAILDERRYSAFKGLLGKIVEGGRLRLELVEGLEESQRIGRYSKSQIVLGPAEYLAGLQFDAVIVAGFPDVSGLNVNFGQRQRRLLSLLYLAVSRSRRKVTMVVSQDYGGVPEILEKAAEDRVIRIEQGREV